MKINSYILANRLKGVNGFQLHSDKRQGTISNVCIYYPNMPIVADCVYIINSKDFTYQYVEHLYSVIIVGSPPEELIKDKHCDIIWCRENLDQNMIFMNVQEIISTFSSWENKLIDMLLSEESLDKICSVSAPIFENPIAIYGRNSQVLAIGESGKYYRLNYQLKSPSSDFISEEIYNQILFDDEFEKTYSTTGAMSYFMNNALHIYENIYIDGEQWGHLVVEAITRDCNDGDYCPLEFLTSIVKKYVILNHCSNYTFMKELKTSIISLIKDSSKSIRCHILSMFEKIGWKNNDEYQCILLRPMKIAESSHTIKNEGNFLENKFKGIMNVILDKDTLIICNKNKLDVSMDLFHKSLIRIIREKMIKCGFSMNFKSFSNIHYYLQQSYIALEMGEKYSPMLWDYHFEDYISQYIIHHGMYDVSPRTLITDGFISMIRYDVEHQTNYFDTLKAYLEHQKSTIKTAELLCIHVSTLNYRIKRIKAMLNDEKMNTTEKILYYSLLCKFVDMYGKDKLIKDIN